MEALKNIVVLCIENGVFVFIFFVLSLTVQIVVFYWCILRLVLEEIKQAGKIIMKSGIPNRKDPKGQSGVK